MKLLVLSLLNFYHKHTFVTDYEQTIDWTTVSPGRDILTVSCRYRCDVPIILCSIQYRKGDFNLIMYQVHVQLLRHVKYSMTDLI